MNDTARHVHELYWEKNYNCAKTMLTCLAEKFEIDLSAQVLHAATGMHGAGRFRAQCGLVEGALMFIGILGVRLGRSDKEIKKLCYRFAEAFTDRFGSLLCRDLRPGGFLPSDPPHACETLTAEAVSFAAAFLENAVDSLRPC